MGVFSWLSYSPVKRSQTTKEKSEDEYGIYRPLYEHRLRAYQVERRLARERSASTVATARAVAAYGAPNGGAVGGSTYGSMFATRNQASQGSSLAEAPTPHEPITILPNRAQLETHIVQIGISFSIGLIFGAPYYAAKAAWKAPPARRWPLAWDGARQHAPQLGSMFAFYNTLYISARRVICYARNTTEFDKTTDIIAAFITGACMSIRRGVIGASVAGAYVAMFVYLLHQSPRFTPTAPGEPKPVLTA